MLKVQALEAFYGPAQVLFGVNLNVNEGEVVALLGRNGMGKTTTISSIMGLIENKTGTLLFQDKPISQLPPHQVAKVGLGLVPEGRRIFPNLTVEENLVATQRGQGWMLDNIFELFPSLEKRRKNMGNQLSGGEQQMLAFGRALLTNPKLLILDEATEGLAPLLRKDIWDSLRLLKERGQAILVVDSNLKELLATADRVYVLEKGKVVWSGLSGELSVDIQEKYLAV